MISSVCGKNARGKNARGKAVKMPEVNMPVVKMPEVYKTYLLLISQKMKVYFELNVVYY